MHQHTPVTTVKSEPYQATFSYIEISQLTGAPGATRGVSWLAQDLTVARRTAKMSSCVTSSNPLVSSATERLREQVSSCAPKQQYRSLQSPTTQQCDCALLKIFRWFCMLI